MQYVSWRVIHSLSFKIQKSLLDRVRTTSRGRGGGAPSLPHDRTPAPTRYREVVLTVSKSDSENCQYDTCERVPSTASAEAYSKPTSTSVSIHLDISSLSARNNAAGSSGARVTSKPSSGCDNPFPIALMYASFRAQQRKNAATCSSFGNSFIVSTSRREKNRVAISSLAKSALMCSTSTPTAASRVTATSATSCECDMLNCKLSSPANAGFPYAL